MKLDCIVVGAGPAGCAAATLLARKGLRVAVLEKSAGAVSKVCGEYLSPGTLRLLDLLGATGSVQASGARLLKGMAIHTAGRRTLDLSYPPGDDGRERFGLALRRPVLDPLLAEVAASAGAEIDRGVQVVDLLWKDGAVAGVTTRSGGGATVDREAAIVIGADGRASVVARRIGRVRHHRWLRKVAIAGYFEGVDRRDDKGEVFLGRNRYAILNPIAPALTNVAVVLDRSEVPARRDERAFLAALGNVHPELLHRLARARLVEPVRSMGPLAYRAERLAGRGVILVGDAAGFLDPFTGEGIYTALRTAEMAAERAIRPLAAGEEHPDLGPYGRDWDREFLPKWRICSLLQRTVRRPWIAECMASQLAHRQALASYLMGAFGDLVPTRDLGLVRLLLRVMSLKSR